MMEEKGRWRGMATDPDFSLWRILDHTRFLIARSREVELARYGLTPEQSFVLDILNESDGCTTINKLVEITQRQHHSISTLIDRMNRQGLVRKTKGGGDKRKYEVEITEKGQELLNRMTRDSVRTIFSCLSDSDKTVLRSCLTLLMAEAYRVLRQSREPSFRPDTMLVQRSSAPQV